MLNSNKLSNIPYEDLDPINKEIVTKHYVIAGFIRKWSNIQNWLIDQFHDKKAIWKNGKYYLPNSQSKLYYQQYLFWGKHGSSTMDPYPSMFNCHLENVLIRELKTDKFDFISVYYGHDIKPEYLKYDTFNKDDWILSQDQSMTLEDIAIMERFKTQFLEFLNYCVNISVCLESKKHRELNKIRDSIFKAMTL